MLQRSNGYDFHNVAKSKSANNIRFIYNACINASVRHFLFAKYDATPTQSLSNPIAAVRISRIVDQRNRHRSALLQRLENFAGAQSMRFQQAFIGAIEMNELLQKYKKL